MEHIEKNSTDAKSVKYIDYLTEDKPIPGQAFACISFISPYSSTDDSDSSKETDSLLTDEVKNKPQKIHNCKIFGLKIKGVYPDKASADKAAHRFREEDKDFDVFVGEVGKWLPWNPDPDTVEDEVYAEEELNNLMGAYKKNRRLAKENLEQRKDTGVKENMMEENKKTQRAERRSRKKGNKAGDIIASEPIETNDADVDDMIKKLNDKIEQLDSERKQKLNIVSKGDQKKLDDDKMKNVLNGIINKKKDGAPKTETA
jgi:hypothetical protein